MRSRSAKLLQGLEAAQADVGIDLHVGAHVHRAVEDALLQGLRGPRMDVLHREPGLDRGHALHVVAGAAGGRGAPVDDARLVEVDVGLDEAGGDEAAFEVEGVGLGTDLRLDGGDPAAGDPDVHRRGVRPGAGDPCPSEYGVQGHRPAIPASVGGASVPAPARWALRSTVCGVIDRRFRSFDGGTPAPVSAVRASRGTMSKGVPPEAAIRRRHGRPGAGRSRARRRLATSAMARGVPSWSVPSHRSQGMGGLP